jgi:hypothetical protein
MNLLTSLLILCVLIAVGVIVIGIFTGADPNKVLTLRSRPRTARLYYEAHVTIAPVFDERRAIASIIALRNGFRLAELLMQKRAEDTPERSRHDTFMTGHGKDYTDITHRVDSVCADLRQHGFEVYRAKIEDTLMDTRMGDAPWLIK